MRPQRGFDVMAALGTLPALVFLLAGGLLGGLTEAGMVRSAGLAFTDDPTRLIIYGCAYLLALLWLISNGRWRGLASAAWPWCVLLSYVLLSAAWSAYPLKVIVNFGHLAGGTLVAWAAVVALRGSGLGVARLVMLALCIVVAMSIVFVKLGLPHAIDPDSARWAGTTGNANTLGLIAAVLCWAATYTTLVDRGRGRMLGILALMLAITGLLGSGSATSLVVAFAMCAGMFWLMAGRRHGSGNLSGRFALGVAITLVAVIVVGTFAPQVMGVESGLHALNRSTSLSGRTELWAFGWDHFTREPLTGYGFDSLASLLSRVSMQVGQLHNGYLDLLLQGGIVGAALFVLMAVRMLWLTVRFSRVHLPEAVMSLMLICGVLAHNITESSLARPVTMLWFMFILAGLIVECPRFVREPANVVHTDAYRDAVAARAAALPNLLR